jgi:hypothetical protein
MGFKEHEQLIAAPRGPDGPSEDGAARDHETRTCSSSEETKHESVAFELMTTGCRKNEASCQTSCQRNTHLTSCKQSIQGGGCSDMPEPSAPGPLTSARHTPICHSPDICEQKIRGLGLIDKHASDSTPEGTRRHSRSQQLHCPNSNTSRPPEGQPTGPFVHASPRFLGS